MSKVSLKKIPNYPDYRLNEETSLVFCGKNIVGRYENKEFVSFDKDTALICEKHGFKYDKSLLEEEEEQMDEEQMDEEQMDEEQTEKEEEEEQVEELESNSEVDNSPTVITQNKVVQDSSIVSSASVSSSVDIQSIISGIQTLNTQYKNKCFELSEEMTKNKELTLKLHELEKSYNLLKTKFDNIKNLFA
jgi:hypothetical protein